MRVAVYPGTFDPITLGHKNVVERGLAVFDKIVVACNAGTERKRPFFPLDDRQDMLKTVFAWAVRVAIATFDGFFAYYMPDQNYRLFLRRIRTF